MPSPPLTSDPRMDGSADNRTVDADLPLFGVKPDADVTFHACDALNAYPHWPHPDVIVSDGAYGVGGFPGDPKTPETLPEWYAPHLQAWSDKAKPSTVLFFWNTEHGWATMHPHLIAAGWVYVQLVVWDKGTGHIAGNVNSKTIRTFPTVTEVCGIYTRPMKLAENEGSLQEWMRDEWKRTGLPFSATNEACGVKNAASRKYFAADHLWYPPPPEMFARIVEYANLHGNPDEAPFFDTEDSGEDTVTSMYEKLRYVFNHRHGITNVWQVPTLRSRERLKSPDGKTLHANQKPLEIMRRCVQSVGKRGDVVWEPFGGTGTGAAAGVEADREVYVAENNPELTEVVAVRLGVEPETIDPDAEYNQEAIAAVFRSLSEAAEAEKETIDAINSRAGIELDQATASRIYQMAAVTCETEMETEGEYLRLAAIQADPDTDPDELL